MKVTLDLTRLRAEGRITPEEHDRLAALSREQGASLAVNLLSGFGVAAVSAAGLALVPVPEAAIAYGLALGAAGAALLRRRPGWRVLGTIATGVAALLVGGGIVVVAEGSSAACLAAAAVLAAAAAVAASGLIAALAVLVLAGALNVGTGYAHALYALSVPQPALTVAAFALLAAGLVGLGRRLAPEGERVALIAARTALVVANLGFWVGSLWGNVWPGEELGAARGLAIPAGGFAAAWALALAGVAAWAVRENRRFAVNACAAFAALHFYTQWFERLGATPLSLLAAGLVLIGAALGLRRFNGRVAQPA